MEWRRGDALRVAQSAGGAVAAHKDGQYNPSDCLVNSYDSDPRLRPNLCANVKSLISPCHSCTAPLPMIPAAAQHKSVPSPSPLCCTPTTRSRLCRSSRLTWCKQQACTKCRQLGQAEPRPHSRHDSQLATNKQHDARKHLLPLQQHYGGRVSDQG